MKQRKPLIAANWKMNGSVSLVDDMVSTLSKPELADVAILVCPPATLFWRFPTQRHYQLGGQTLNQNKSGAFTGELSAELLLEAGVSFVLIGHSERRSFYDETDEMVADKLAAAVEQGLQPVLCVGETLTEREQQKTQQVLAKQLAAVYASQPELLAKSVIAYEPVWAIGTGESATPEIAQSSHAFIRQQLAKYDADAAAVVQILYGGSVNAENCAALFAQPDIDGALVGGASLKPAEFEQICLSVKSAKE